MKQSIVALIRPKLNLAQKESEATHLIEHILVAPKRLDAIGISADFYAKNIIYHGGYINDFYLTEYYIVRSEIARELAKMLSSHQNNLHINMDDFENIKAALLEEIRESKGEFIDLGEQLAKAIYLPDSPSIRNPWDNLDSVKNITYDKIIEIFEQKNSDIVLLNLSFDDYNVGKLPVLEKNIRKENTKLVELTHPWQSPGSVDNYITIYLPEKTDFTVNLFYCRSLVDYQFGLLFDKLRTQAGLVYDISVSVDYNENTLEFYFSSSEDASEKAINLIKKSLEKYDVFIKENLKYIKKRLSLEFELDWGDIQNQSSWYIDQIMKAQFTENPKNLLKTIQAITADDLIVLNQVLLNKLKNETFYAKRIHGKELKSKVS